MPKRERVITNDHDHGVRAINPVASHLRQELVEHGIGAVYSPQPGRGPEEGAADMAALTHWLREGDLSYFLSQHRSADPNRAAS